MVKHSMNKRLGRKKQTPIYDIRAVKDVGRSNYYEHMQTQTRPCVYEKNSHTSALRCNCYGMNSSLFARQMGFCGCSRSSVCSPWPTFSIQTTRTSSCARSLLRSRSSPSLCVCFFPRTWQRGPRLMKTRPPFHRGRIPTLAKTFSYLIHRVLCSRTTLFCVGIKDLIKNLKSAVRLLFQSALLFRHFCF